MFPICISERIEFLCNSGIGWLSTLPSVRKLRINELDDNTVNELLEFGEREELPMRIAVANSAAEFTGAIGPLLGGVLVAVGSYATVFWTAIGFQAAAVLVVLVGLSFAGGLLVANHLAGVDAGGLDPMADELDAEELNGFETAGGGEEPEAETDENR